MQDDQCTKETLIGPQSDGTYHTPYAVTVYYNSACLFEVACAMFVRGCQKVPITDTSQLDGAADSAEHPSARVILFDSRHKPEQFFHRGFCSITVIGNNTWKDAEGDITRLCLTDFIDSLRLTLAQRWVLDHFALLLFPDYQPCSTEVTLAAAKSLGLAVRCMAVENNLETQMVRLISGDVFENVQCVIYKGRGIRCAQDIMIRNLVETGVRTHASRDAQTVDCLWIPSTSLDRAAQSYALTQAHIVCTYRPTAHDVGITLVHKDDASHWDIGLGEPISAEKSDAICIKRYKLSHSAFAEILSRE